MIQFEEAKKGYKKEQVEEYIGTVSSEYEKLHEELKSARVEIGELKEKAESLEKDIQYFNSPEYATQQKVISSAIVSAEISGQQIIEEARKEASNIEEEARQEFATILNDKQKALTELGELREKLGILLRDELGRTELYSKGITLGR